MFHIKHNILFSVMAHSVLVAAVLISGGSSELRRADPFTVSLFDEKENFLGSKGAAVVVVRQAAYTLETPNPAMATDRRLSEAQEIILNRGPAPLAPVKFQSNADRDSASGVMDFKGQSYASQATGNGTSAASRSAAGSSSEGEGTASVSLIQADRAAQSVASPSPIKRIRDTLQGNLVYPYLARKRGMEGTVLVDFRIDPVGRAEHVRVLKGSGYALLDSSAIETVVRSSPFPLANCAVEVPITYRLTGN